MQGSVAPVQVTFAVGAAMWPLVAGLSVVLWSKMRAARGQTALAVIRQH